MEGSRLAAVVIAAVLATLAGAVWSRARAEEPPKPESSRIVFTADTRGNLEPCGCEKGQFGGIARRATALATLRRPGDLLLDLGNLGAGPGDLHRLGWTATLAAMRELRYDVFVPGASDLLDVEALIRESHVPGTPAIVCANLQRAADGKPAFEPWVVRSLPSGARVAIVGLTSDSQDVPSGYRVLSPLEASRAALKELGGRVDRVVLAGWIEGKPAFDLAKALPEAALVLAGNVPRGSEELLRRAGAPVMAGGERGQYIVAVELDALGRPTAGARTWLGEQFADEPTMIERVRSWKADLAGRADAELAATMEAFRKAGRVGSAVCAECHAAEHRGWAESKHAHAVPTLATRGEQRNPLCLKCHQQDVVSKNGEIAADPDSGVGCEGCHGAGRSHVDAHRARRSPTPLTQMRKVNPDSCITCHDENNSRSFEFQSYWKRIQHGRAARTN